MCLWLVTKHVQFNMSRSQVPFKENDQDQKHTINYHDMKFEAHSLRHIVKQIKEALAGTQINSRIKIAQCITMQTPQFVTYFLSLSLLWGGLKRPGTNAGEPEVPPPECQVPFRECCLLVTRPPINLG